MSFHALHKETMKTRNGSLGERPVCGRQNRPESARGGRWGILAVPLSRHAITCPLFSINSPDGPPSGPTLCLLWIHWSCGLVAKGRSRPGPGRLSLSRGVEGTWRSREARTCWWSQHTRKECRSFGVDFVERRRPRLLQQSPPGVLPFRRVVSTSRGAFVMVSGSCPAFFAHSLQ